LDKCNDILKDIKMNYDREFYEFVASCVHIKEDMRKSASSV